MPQITQSDIFGDPSLWTPLAPYGGTPLGAYPDTYGLGQTGYGQQGPSLGGQPPPYGGGAGGYQPPAYGGGAAGYQPPPFDPGAFVGGGGGGQPQSFQDSGGGALTTGLGALSALSAADKYLLDGQLGASAKEFLGNIPIPGGSNIADLFGLGPSPYEYSVAQGEGALTGLGEFSGPSRAVMDRAIAPSAPPIAPPLPPTPGPSPLDFQPSPGVPQAVPPALVQPTLPTDLATGADALFGSGPEAAQAAQAARQAGQSMTPSQLGSLEFTQPPFSPVSPVSPSVTNLSRPHSVESMRALAEHQSTQPSMALQNRANVEGLYAGDATGLSMTRQEVVNFADMMNQTGVPTGGPLAPFDMAGALGDFPVGSGGALGGQAAAQAAAQAQALEATRMAAGPWSAAAPLAANAANIGTTATAALGAGSGPMSFGAVPANIMVGGGGPLAGLQALQPYGAAGMAAIAVLKRLGRSSSKHAVQAMGEGTGAAFQAITNPNFGLPQAQRFASLTGLPFDDYGEYGDPRTLETGANVGGLFNRIEAAGGRAALSPSAQRLYDDLRNHQVVLQERKNAESLAALGMPADVVRPAPVSTYSPTNLTPYEDGGGVGGGIQPYEDGGGVAARLPDYSLRPVYRQIQPYDPRLLQQVMPSSSGQTYGDTAAGRLLKQGMSPSQVDEYLRNVGP